MFLLENLVNVQNKKVIFTLKRVKYEHLQEFQYGNNVFQTTTNNLQWKVGSSPPVSEKWGGEAKRMAKLFGYGNMVWQNVGVLGSSPSGITRSQQNKILTIIKSN